MKSTTKSKFFHVALMRCLVKFVVLQSHSQSTCVLNQCHIRINTHLVSHIETFCFSLYFSPRNLSHCCFCFHSTVLQQYIWKRLWKGKQKQITYEIFLFPRTYNSQSTNKKSSFFIWKFLSFPIKVFWDTTWLCRKWFCPLSTVILRFVFQK